MKSIGSKFIAVHEVNVSFNMLYPLIISFDLIILSHLLNNHEKSQPVFLLADLYDDVSFENYTIVFDVVILKTTATKNT